MRLKVLSWMMAALIAAIAAPAGAAMIMKMNLAQLTDRADTIFRGEVLSVEPGKIAIGGGTLPTVTYRLRVDESGYCNLSFAGDWTRNGFDLPTVEAAVLSGLQVGQALSAA